MSHLSTRVALIPVSQKKVVTIPPKRSRGLYRASVDPAVVTMNRVVCPTRHHPTVTTARTRCPIHRSTEEKVVDCRGEFPVSRSRTSTVLRPRDS